MKLGICKIRLLSAFTLVELLVVIALIAVLASLLLPALSRAKATGQRTVCLQKLQQWGLAMSLYLDENNEFFPREDALDDINSWAVVAAPENKDVWYNCVAEKLDGKTAAQYATNPSSQRDFYARSSMFTCPSARFSAAAAGYPMFSLVINSQLMDYSEERFGLASIEEPAETALFLDCGVPDEPQGYPFQRKYNGQPKAYANRFSGRHRDGGNIAFVDGHVSWFRVSDIVTMDDNDIRRGRSIFPPQRVIWCRRRDLKP